MASLGIPCTKLSQRIDRGVYGIQKKYLSNNLGIEVYNHLPINKQVANELGASEWLVMA